MKKISKLFCLFTCLCLTACGDVTSSFTPTKGVTKLLNEVKEPNKITNDPTKDIEFNSFLDKFTSFALRFNDSYLNKYDNKAENIAISPLSLFFALAMTSECVANNSQIELLNALNMTTSELRKNIPTLYALENSTIYTTNDNDQDVLVSVKDLNNSIWFSNDLNKSQSTLNNLADYYYTESYETDFYGNNSNANKDFREYVKDKTRGLIDRNFNLSQETLLILLNTLYLKDIWDISGGLSFTDNKYDFISRNNKITNTKLLQGKYVAGRAINKKEYSSFFTRTKNGLKLHFLLPNDSYTLEDVFIKENIDYILDSNNYELSNHELKEKYFTSIEFPTFEASCDNNLVQLLSDDFEINDIFNASKADFSNVSSDKMYVNQVVHSTKLKVDQKGIEGAAITSIMVPGSSGPSLEEYKNVYETFLVNKSFGYIITDSYGVTLFSGVINNIN